MGSLGHVPLWLFEPEPLPPPVLQSDGHVETLSPFVVSHWPLPHTAPVALPLPLLFPPVPQSCAQLLTSVAEHVPSPHTVCAVPPP